ncbi:endonuclease/exonuclease/phosphatase family protein [Propionibacteriaceae bacterium Y2011]
MRRILLLAVTCVTALLTVTVTAVAAPGSGGRGAQAAPIRVIQHNTDHVPEAWDFLLQHIEEFQPDLVAVQEVCLPWFTELQRSKPNWTMAFHPRKRHFGGKNNPGCYGDFIGEAVIHTRAPNGPTLVVDYPNNNADGVEKFGMACVEFRQRGIPTLGCSTHLSAYPTSGGRGTQPERAPQVGSIMDHTAPYREANWAVIVGGDFNLTSEPGNEEHAADMNLIMGPAVGGNGAFHDVSQLERTRRLTKPTTDKNRRIDYVFMSANRTPWGTAATMEYADSPAGHHLLRARSTLRHGFAGR